MTPAARVQSAIEILDRALAGEPTEKILTSWARANRFAGSKDRAAIRDLVFDAIRCKRSYAHLGGALTGRGLMLGRARVEGNALDILFDGSKYGPDLLTPQEAAFSAGPLAPGDAVDLPDWLWDTFQRDLGDMAEAAAKSLRTRSPVYLRVNLAKTDVESARASLAQDQIATETSPLSETALMVTENPRRVSQSQAYKSGLVDLQDAASQAVCDFIDLSGVNSVLDYCAGGGGKSLAIAAKAPVKVTAHDAIYGRMSDLPERAKRAGATIQLTETVSNASKFDLVLCDVPCSGSGSWRRSPDGKWDLTAEKLKDVIGIQREILTIAAQHVNEKGILAYATCSLLKDENDRQVEWFLSQNSEWKLAGERQFLPQQGGDGFYIATLTRS